MAIEKKTKGVLFDSQEMIMTAHDQLKIDSHLMVWSTLRVLCAYTFSLQLSP